MACSLLTIITALMSIRGCWRPLRMLPFSQADVHTFRPATTSAHRRLADTGETLLAAMGEDNASSSAHATAAGSRPQASDSTCWLLASERGPSHPQEATVDAAPTARERWGALRAEQVYDCSPFADSAGGAASRGVDARADGGRRRSGIANTTAVTVVEEDADTQSIGSNQRHLEPPVSSGAVWPPRRAPTGTKEAETE